MTYDPIEITPYSEVFYHALKVYSLISPATIQVTPCLNCPPSEPPNHCLTPVHSSYKTQDGRAKYRAISAHTGTTFL